MPLPYPLEPGCWRRLFDRLFVFFEHHVHWLPKHKHPGTRRERNSLVVLIWYLSYRKKEDAIAHTLPNIAFLWWISSGSTFQMPDRMYLTHPTSLTLFAATTRLNSLKEQLMQRVPRSKSPGVVSPTHPSTKIAILGMSTVSCSERFPTSKAKSCSRDLVKAISRYIVLCFLHETCTYVANIRVVTNSLHYVNHSCGNCKRANQSSHGRR